MTDLPEADPLDRQLRDPRHQPWIEPSPGFADRVVAGLGVRSPAQRKVWTARRIAVAALALVAVSVAVLAGLNRDTAHPAPGQLVEILHRLPADLQDLVPEQELLREWQAITDDATAAATRLTACLPR